MSDLYEKYIELCAKSDEQDEIMGHIAGVTFLLAIINSILCVLAIVFSSLSFLNVVQIISWVIVGINCLRILVYNIEMTSVLSAIVRIFIVSIIMVALMMCIRFIPVFNSFLETKFSAADIKSAKWYFSFIISGYSTLILARFL